MANFYVRAFGASVLSALLGFLVACGDSAIHRESIAKLPADAQRRASHTPRLNADGKFADPGSQEAEDSINDHLDADNSYSVLPGEQWPKGSYVLTSVDTFAKFMPNASSSWVHVFNTSQVTIAGGVATAAATSPPITVGILNNKTDNGIAVQIPASFDTKNSQPFMDDMKDNKDTLQIFISKILTKGTAVVVSDRFDTFNGAIPFDTVLAGNYGDKSYKALLRRIDGTHFEAELNKDDTTSIKGTTISRTIVFVYTFTPAVAPADKSGKVKTNDTTTPGAATGTTPGAAPGADEDEDSTLI